MEVTKPDEGKRNQRSYTKIGTFQLSQPVLYVSDPCYDKDDVYTKKIENCEVGSWAAYINVNHYRWNIKGNVSTDKRVAAVFVRHESLRSHSVLNQISWKSECVRYPNSWSLISESIAVDSGQAGIFDYEKYGNNDLFESEGECGFGDKWYSNCCDATLQGHAGIIANMGVNASSGFGDGCFMVWGHKNKTGKYDAVALFFLEDDDLIED